MEQSKKICLRKKKKHHVYPQDIEFNCENQSTLQIYMNLLAERVKKHDEEDINESEFLRRRKRTSAVALITNPSPMPFKPICYKLNAFNLENRTDGQLPSTRIWDMLRNCPTATETSLPIKNSDDEWPKLWPCLSRDEIRERKILVRKKKMKEKGMLPCDIDAIDSPGTSDDEKMQELTYLKELGHARIPVSIPKKTNLFLVDESSGDKFNLVNGDYLKYMLCSKKATRVFTTVCLRGMQGMHLEEIERIRVNTWKFCLYQALIALLVKTQLRYKYAWSANIDYIYEQAWTLYLHMGYINAKQKQRFDDVLVYNYRYSVEIEMVHEFKCATVYSDFTSNYIEKTTTVMRQKPRKEITLAKSVIGEKKSKDSYVYAVHHGTKAIEEWFDNLDVQYTNCIFRTTRFALAFWEDGLFWYVYNPYRCDQFGFWNDDGYACIVKFCTKESLKRHLMILLVRAYAYGPNKVKPYDSWVPKDKGYVEELPECDSSMNLPRLETQAFNIQIYQMIYHSCNIHNIKLLTRKAPKTRVAKYTEKIDENSYGIDSPSFDYGNLSKNDTVEEGCEKCEKPSLLQDYTILWVRQPPAPKCADAEKKNKGPKWHSYDILIPHRLFVLWGDIHISDKIFAVENRHKQALCCYAVCAGMCLMNAPEYWSGQILDTIVVCGDRFYSERMQRLMNFTGNSASDLGEAVNDLDDQGTDKFYIGETLLEVSFLPVMPGRLFVGTNQCLWHLLEQLFLSHRFAILACTSIILGVFRQCGAYYIFDVHSFGPPVFKRGHGSSYLLRASCFDQFIANIILTIGAPESHKFTLRPVRIVRAVDLGNSDNCPKNRTACHTNVKCDEVGIFRAACPLDEVKRKRDKKGRKSYADAEMERKEKDPKIVCCGGT